MTDLLPCPFCGGEAETLTAESMHGGYLFGIMCNDCRSRGDVYDTEAEAIAAWNTRAERTCHAELNDGRNAVVCSECGSSMLLEGWEEMKDWGGNTLINTFKTYPYCHKCGARVISENEPVEVWQQASADDVTCYEAEQ